jgi:hypothetical protein
LRRAWPIDDTYKVNPVGHLNWKTKWLDGAPAEPGHRAFVLAIGGGSVVVGLPTDRPASCTAGVGAVARERPQTP